MYNPRPVSPRRNPTRRHTSHPAWRTVNSIRRYAMHGSGQIPSLRRLRARLGLGGLAGVLAWVRDEHADGLVLVDRHVRHDEPLRRLAGVLLGGHLRAEAGHRGA